MSDQHNQNWPPNQGGTAPLAPGAPSTPVGHAVYPAAVAAPPQQLHQYPVQQQQPGPQAGWQQQPYPAAQAYPAQHGYPQNQGWPGQPGYPGQPIQIVVQNTNSNAAVAQTNAGPVYAERKSPALAAILSFFIVGLGQLYNGQIGKAVLMFFGCVALWMVLLGWVVNIWSVIDAYSTADRINRGVA